MNYFKARYFKAKSKRTWVLPPDEVIDISGDRDGVRGVEKAINEERKRRLLIQEDEVLQVIKMFLICQN